MLSFSRQREASDSKISELASKHNEEKKSVKKQYSSNLAVSHTFYIMEPDHCTTIIWTASSEFGTYHLCEQGRFRRACASAQSRQNLRCSLIQAVSQDEPSDRKPDPWPL